MNANNRPHLRRPLTWLALLAVGMGTAVPSRASWAAPPAESPTTSDSESTAPPGRAEPPSIEVPVQRAPAPGDENDEGAEDTAPGEPPALLPDPNEAEADEAELGSPTDPGRVKVDGKAVDGVDDIEDLGLEGLLGMDLGEQLGTTEAASAKEEDVLRAPATLTTIDAEEIRLSGATNIPDLLRRVPGLQVTRAASGNDVVAIRGTGGLANNNLVVMLDGTPIASPLDGSVDWDLIPISTAEIERIEVVRGPVSPVYGANAYTGVINIVTREAIGITPSVHARGLGGVDLEAAPIGEGSASVVHVGEKVSGKWFINAGYDDSYNSIPESDERHPANLRVGTVGNIDARLGEHAYLHGQIGGSYSERSGMDILVRESEPTDRFLGFAHLAVGWKDLPGATKSVEVWVRDRAHVIDTDPDLYAGLNYTDTRSNRTEGGIDVSFLPFDIWEIHAGLSGLVDYIDAPYINEADRGVHPGYGYRVGTRVSPTKTLDLGFDLRGDAPPTMGRLIHSARLTGVYHRDDWALRISAGSAFRALTYVESAGQFIDPNLDFVLLEGDPTLRPPVNGSVEIGAIVSPLTGLTIAPTIYYSGLYSAVVTDFEPVPRKTFRQDQSPRDLVGGEFEIRWRQSDAFVLSGAVGAQYFVRADPDEIATVGVPEQNSVATGSLRAYGVTLNEKLGYGVGGRVATPRRYRANAGIPLRIVDVEVPTTADLDAMIEYRLPDRFPLWISLRARSFLMPGVIEAPFNEAAPRGTSFLLGLEYRGR